MDRAKVSRELLRAVRGKLSQGAVNRRLRVQHNQVSRWERGRVEISWVDFVHLCGICRRDLVGPLAQVFHWHGSPSDGAGLFSFLTMSFSQADVSRMIGVSPYRQRRWRLGVVSPSLLDVISIFQELKHQLADFVLALGVMDKMPSLDVEARSTVEWQAIQTDMPFASSLLHAMTTQDYKNLGRHVPGWLSERLGLNDGEEATGLAALQAGGLIRWRSGAYVAPHAHFFGGGFAVRKSAQKYWLGRASRRVDAMTERREDERFRYFFYAVSRKTERALLDRCDEFFADIRRIVEADSDPEEVVRSFNLQLFDPGAGTAGPAENRRNEAVRRV